MDQPNGTLPSNRSGNRAHKRASLRCDAHRLMTWHEPSVGVHDLDKLVLALDVQPLHRGPVSYLAFPSFSSTSGAIQSDAA
jgi:hypothetical protein